MRINVFLIVLLSTVSWSILFFDRNRSTVLPLDYLLRWIGIASQCSIVETIKLKII
jgi:hypothetical protein